jgi:Flp pilus assembly protein TadB
LLTGDVEPAVRDAALDAIESHPGDPASPAARQPIRRPLRALDTYLGLSNLRRRWIAESITGRQPTAVLDRIYSAARQDAGLQRHLKRSTSLASFGLVVVVVLAITVVLTLVRLGIRLAALLWAVWWIDLALIGAALLTLLPAARGLRHTHYVGGMIRLLQRTAAAGAAILAVAVLVYTWWVWLLVLLAAISAFRIFFARMQARSCRRIAEVVQRAASFPEPDFRPGDSTPAVS